MANAYPSREQVVTVQQFLAHYLGEALIGDAGLVAAVADLDNTQLHFRPTEDANAIGFDAWHVFRTVDNIIHFAFEREPTVWLQQGLDAAWELPKNAQGTGMTAEEARALRFPSAAALAQYGRDVAVAVLPRIEAMTDEYLQAKLTIRPFGEITRLVSIGTNLVTHANQHLGQVNICRTLLGKASLGF
ncbi:MAG: DinB family protein [Chloroflexi bacterium]|nr:MAG: DinB family protein [Chloroflexota bacterium]